MNKKIKNTYFFSIIEVKLWSSFVNIYFNHIITDKNRFSKLSRDREKLFLKEAEPSCGV
jgi:hypothetical protein